MRFTATSHGSRPELDLEAVCRLVDLRSIVGADLGAPLRGGRWPCPFHNGERPNFGVNDQRFRCWKCGESGDVLDYIMKRDGLTLMEAVAKIDPSIRLKPAAPSRPVSAPSPRPKTEPATPRQAVDWQVAIDALVCLAESSLWSSEGREALDWLRSRGLEDSTIKRFRLGFLDRPYSSEPVPSLGDDRWGNPCRVYADRGITLPWVSPESCYSAIGDSEDLGAVRWVGCNIRRLADGPLGQPLPPDVDKYRAVRGSQRGYGYPWCEPSMVGEAAIITEGEFDALVAWQEVGWICNVATFGGASQGNFPLASRAYLAACPDLMLAFDHDEAGDKAALDWRSRNPGRSRRLYLPDGFNDLNDFHRSGQSVLMWLRGEYQRFGWDWPSKPLSQHAAPVVHLAQSDKCGNPENPSAQIHHSSRPPAIQRWSIARRQRWADRAEALQSQGVPLWEAEARAYEETKAA